MAKLPTVAIIGKPNTGKSTLFNRLVGRRRAIVSDIPGTTRDHVAHKVETDDVDYLLVDTGGLGGSTADTDMEDNVTAQSVLALEHADVILFTVNSREELTTSDFEVADVLRKKRKTHVPVILVVTKCDNPMEIEQMLPQFYQLHITDSIIPISATHRIGMDDLQNSIAEELKNLHFVKSEEKETDEENALPRIALIGKPNVGKSSIINALMSETKLAKSPLLVSDIPGTTRDATDTVVKYHDREYVLVDTAGIKRRNQTDEGIETFAYLRSIHSLEEADIAVLVLDALQPVSKQDKRIAGMAVEEGKGLVVLVNKMDLLKGAEKTERMKEIAAELQFCRFASFVSVSAETRDGLLKLFDLLEMVQRSRTRRIGTKDLQAWYQTALHNQPLGALNQSKFITQADEVPPTFVVFVKDPKKVQESHLRYLENRMRETFGFEGTPIRWITKSAAKGGTGVRIS